MKNLSTHIFVPPARGDSRCTNVVQISDVKMWMNVRNGEK
jgi:hypothetical protein